MKRVVTRKAGSFPGPKPEILAPAGSRDAFLAALAAGADAIYCGLKKYSARMAAVNFSLEELIPLAELAKKMSVKLYLTFNTLVKPDELQPLGRQLDVINRHLRPDGLIIQDLAVGALARQVGFEGQLHLSTLANVTNPQALKGLGKTYGIERVVLPRELNVDEIKLMAQACPQDMGLELFVHGALCYGVSGRCYWSSLLGGKSGLRGRCVQPCRRRYAQEQVSERYFSCQDFSLDVLVKSLAPIPSIRAWKIEGRKKGPHYVYYTVTAYKMLRDEGRDPQLKKAAVQLLERSLGRLGTHYGFLPQRPQKAIDTSEHTGSGLFAGVVQGSKDKPYLEPRFELLARDRLRIGYEDDDGHKTVKLSKFVPKHGKYYFDPSLGRLPGKGTSVFLVDRREPALDEKIQSMASKLATNGDLSINDSYFALRLPPAAARKPDYRLMHVLRKPGEHMRKTSLALWLNPELVKRMPAAEMEQAWWWLPPVIWPEETELWQKTIIMLRAKGARRFMLNAPWQMVFFKRLGRLNLWGGPFCNFSNPMAIRAFKLAGGRGVIVSPELARADLKALAAKSVLPLGVVVFGNWPFCVSRTLAHNFKLGQPFTSPRGEAGWVQKHGSLYWAYPNWLLDLRKVQNDLINMGYGLLIHLDEPIPSGISIKKRPGDWNWEIGLD
ncbi:MAG: U32 family peptidase [Desulfobacteraceae bacterium]|nr:U32 family peptidase [Desulfobacteraceae bacterium]